MSKIGKDFVGNKMMEAIAAGDMATAR